MNPSPEDIPAAQRQTPGFPGPACDPEPGDVHVWIVDYRLNSAARLRPLLSESERNRADRFRKPVDQDRSIVRRGALRRVLARYLKIDAASIVLDQGPFGKPMLAAGQSMTDLQFNLSTSRDLVLIAIARVTVGIDIEFVDPVIDVSELVPNVLSAEEMSDFADLLPEQRTSVFFSYWTAKEACVKCSGQGLGLDLKQIHVMQSKAQLIHPDSPLGDRHFQAKQDETGWSLMRFSPGPGYTAAVACFERIKNVRTSILDPIVARD